MSGRGWTLVESKQKKKSSSKKSTKIETENSFEAIQLRKEHAAQRRKEEEEARRERNRGIEAEKRHIENEKKRRREIRERYAQKGKVVIPAADVLSEQAGEEVVRELQKIRNEHSVMHVVLQYVMGVVEKATRGCVLDEELTSLADKIWSPVNELGETPVALCVEKMCDEGVTLEDAVRMITAVFGLRGARESFPPGEGIGAHLVLQIALRVCAQPIADQLPIVADIFVSDGEFHSPKARENFLWCVSQAACVPGPHLYRLAAQLGGLEALKEIPSFVAVLLSNSLEETEEKPTKACLMSAECVRKFLAIADDEGSLAALFVTSQAATVHPRVTFPIALSLANSNQNAVALSIECLKHDALCFKIWGDNYANYTLETNAVLLGMHEARMAIDVDFMKNVSGTATNILSGAKKLSKKQSHVTAADTEMTLKLLDKRKALKLVGKRKGDAANAAGGSWRVLKVLAFTAITLFALFCVVDVDNLGK